VTASQGSSLTALCEKKDREQERKRGRTEVEAGEGYVLKPVLGNTLICKREDLPS